jgi:hypothetical protein
MAMSNPRGHEARHFPHLLSAFAALSLSLVTGTLTFRVWGGRTCVKPSKRMRRRRAKDAEIAVDSMGPLVYFTRH